MATDNIDNLWIYITGKDGLTEEEFKALAQEAKQRGLLDLLHERVNEQMELHRYARDQFIRNSEPEKAQQHKEKMEAFERELAIMEYLRFSNFN